MTEYILIEHISGLELFRLKSFEDIVNKSFMDYTALTEIITHVSSYKFDSVLESFSLMKSEDYKILQNFLEINSVKILHADKSLQKFLKDLNIEYKFSPNIARGIKFNLHKFLKTSENKQMILGVSHTFSKEVIGTQRDDNFVVFEGYEIDQLEGEIEQIKKRLNAKIDYFLPFFRKSLSVDLNEEEEIKKLFLNNQNIESKKCQLLNVCIEEMIKNIPETSKLEILQLIKLKEEKIENLNKLKIHFVQKMKKVIPNLREIVGDKIGAQMLHKAGGLSNLAMAPASTIQVLGAEKALFRCLKNKSIRTPKHGIVYDILNTSCYKGRMSRFIANKVAIAAKIDCYDSIESNSFGQELRRLCNKKANSLKTGEFIETTGDLLKRVSRKLQNLPVEEPTNKLDKKNFNRKNSNKIYQNNKKKFKKD